MESWVQVSPLEGTGNGEVQITVKANHSPEERTTTINVETSTLNKILTIIQKGELDMQLGFLLFTESLAGGGEITATWNGEPINAASALEKFGSFDEAPFFIAMSGGTASSTLFVFSKSIKLNKSVLPGVSATVTFLDDVQLLINSSGISKVELQA